MSVYSVNVRYDLTEYFFLHRKYWLYKPLLNLGMTMTKQSLLKHVLTEGDKMLISVLSSAEDRGVYAFVVNYGKHEISLSYDIFL